jgi:hypothetical protein
VIDLVQEARELNARMEQAERGTILRDELRLRRNRRLRWLHQDDPERWTNRRLAAAVGMSEGNVYSVTRG